MVFWEYSTWSTVIQFAVLCVILLIANILRRKIPFLRKSLLPTAVIGGFLALILRSVGVLDKILTPDFLDKITYHALAIGFIALGLKTAYGTKEVRKKGIAVSGIDNGLIIVSCYVIQGVLGLIVTYLLGVLFMPNLFKAAGLLLPMGFGQGPGQANNFGSVYELQYGFIGGQSFGLSIASLGFVWACIPGVIYMNILKRKGKLKLRTNDSQTITDADVKEMVGVKNEIPLTESMDKMTIQIAIVLTVLLLTYLFMWGFDAAFVESGILGNFGVNTLRPLIWGFNFIFGTLFAILARKIISGFHKTKFMNRVYVSNFMMNRIAGVVFDFMIVASICAIDINVLSGLIVPLILVTTVGGFSTFFYLKKIAPYFYKGYEVEGLLGMYGMMTGTASTGVALIREVDPEFNTPASENLVSGSVGAMVFGFPLMLLISSGPNIPILTMILGTLFFCILNIGLFRKKIFKKRDKK